MQVVGVHVLHPKGEIMSDDLTLEKLEISKKIGTLEVAVGSLTENIKISHTTMQNLLEKHNDSLYGDGNGKVGMNVRVDRLEQIEDNRKWHLRALWGSIVAAVLKILHLSLK
jgi:hypothetical protein